MLPWEFLFPLSYQLAFSPFCIFQPPFPLFPLSLLSPPFPFTFFSFPSSLFSPFPILSFPFFLLLSLFPLLLFPPFPFSPSSSFFFFLSYHISCPFQVLLLSFPFFPHYLFSLSIVIDINFFRISREGQEVNSLSNLLFPFCLKMSPEEKKTLIISLKSILVFPLKCNFTSFTFIRPNKSGLGEHWYTIIISFQT